MATTIESKVDKTATCWRWTASTRRGYGSFWNPQAGRTVRATVELRNRLFKAVA